MKTKQNKPQNVEAIYIADSLAPWQTSLLQVCSVNRSPPICHLGTRNIFITTDQKPSSSSLDIFRGETAEKVPGRAIHQQYQPEDSSVQNTAVKETLLPNSGQFFSE